MTRSIEPEIKASQKNIDGEDLLSEFLGIHNITKF
jgi:hypothetical protein